MKNNNNNSKLFLTATLVNSADVDLKKYAESKGLVIKPLERKRKKIKKK